MTAHRSIEPDTGATLVLALVVVTVVALIVTSLLGLTGGAQLQLQRLRDTNSAESAASMVLSLAIDEGRRTFGTGELRDSGCSAKAQDVSLPGDDGSVTSVTCTSREVAGTGTTTGPGISVRDDLRISGGPVVVTGGVVVGGALTSTTKPCATDGRSAPTAAQVASGCGHLHADIGSLEARTCSTAWLSSATGTVSCGVRAEVLGATRPVAMKLPIATVPVACPKSGVLTLEPAVYDDVAVESLNALTSAAAPCKRLRIVLSRSDDGARWEHVFVSGKPWTIDSPSITVVASRSGGVGCPASGKDGVRLVLAGGARLVVNAGSLVVCGHRTAGDPGQIGIQSLTGAADFGSTVARPSSGCSLDSVLFCGALVVARGASVVVDGIVDVSPSAVAWDIGSAGALQASQGLRAGALLLIVTGSRKPAFAGVEVAVADRRATYTARHCDTGCGTAGKGRVVGRAVATFTRPDNPTATVDAWNVVP